MNREEHNYLNLIKGIIDNGDIRDDRTGIGTHSTFGNVLRFDVGNGKMPLITTRKMNFKIAVEEFLFMWSGKTQTKLLEAKGINIWKCNTSKEFQQKVGLGHLEEGDMGKMYGFQLRNFGMDYENWDFHEGEYIVERNSIDQLHNFIETLKKDPYSRRHIITTFNPYEVKEGVLYPCHGIVIQAYVNTLNQISLNVYIRSSDTILGLPTNVSFYTIFLNVVAKLCKLEPKELVITLGDTHIYNNHIDKFLSKQFLREPFEFPTFKITKEINSIEDVESMISDDFELNNYQSHSGLIYEMAI